MQKQWDNWCHRFDNSGQSIITKVQNLWNTSWAHFSPTGVRESSSPVITSCPPPSQEWGGFTARVICWRTFTHETLLFLMSESYSLSPSRLGFLGTERITRFNSTLKLEVRNDGATRHWAVRVVTAILCCLKTNMISYCIFSLGLQPMVK